MSVELRASGLISPIGLEEQQPFFGWQLRIDDLAQYVDGLLTFGLGDWYDIGPRGAGESQLTSKGLTATAIYYQDLVTLARIAALLNKAEDARRFASEADGLKIAFNHALYHADTKTYDRGSQTAYAMPLYLGLVPEQDQAFVLANLVADIRAHNNHVTAEILVSTTWSARCCATAAPTCFTT